MGVTQWRFVTIDKNGDETPHIVLADSISSAWRGITQDLCRETLAQTVEIKFDGLWK